MPNAIPVSPTVLLDAWYDKSLRVWCARYVDNARFQIGDAWYGTTRDAVLIFRPATPEN